MIDFWHACNLPNCTTSFLALGSDQRRLGIILIAILSFAGIEWGTGYFCHSLALRSDAWHMVTDAGAIVLALSANSFVRLNFIRRLPRRWQLETLAAFVNAIALVVMAGLILCEGIQHLLHPPQSILSGPMFVTAMLGFGVNLMGVYLLHNEHQANLNIRGAFLHMLADLASSIGVVVSAVAIAIFQCFWLDGVMSLLIALLICQSAFSLLQTSWRQWSQPLNLVIPEIGHTQVADLISKS